MFKRNKNYRSASETSPQLRVALLPGGDALRLDGAPDFFHRDPRVGSLHGGEEEDEHKQSEEYKEHERAWAELLDKMVGWVYTLNEAAAEGTDTRVTMEEVRRIIESQRIPAGKQSHTQLRRRLACAPVVLVPFTRQQSPHQPLGRITGHFAERLLFISVQS